MSGSQSERGIIQPIQDLTVPSGDVRLARFVKGEYPLPSGNLLLRRERTEPDSALGRAYQVQTPEGEFTGITFDAFESDERDSAELVAGWRKKHGLPAFLEVSNNYFARVASAEDCMPEAVNIKTYSEYSWGDHIEEGTAPFPVEESWVEAIAEQMGERFGDVDDVRVSGPGGALIDQGFYMRIYPSFPQEGSKKPILDAIEEVFRTTTSDEKLIPVFQDALKVVVTHEF